jgi:hypothetical protein
MEAICAPAAAAMSRTDAPLVAVFGEQAFGSIKYAQRSSPASAFGDGATPPGSVWTGGWGLSLMFHLALI